MTMVAHLAPTPVRSRWVFRLSILLWATFLGMQCIWLVSAELFRPGIIQMPTDKSAAATAARHSEAAELAASIGIIRGDLWAEAAFARADSLWGSAGSETRATVRDSVQRASEQLRRAVRDAPHRSDAWLLAAGLAQRFTSTGFDPSEALRMSYYTGSSEIRLVPLRLKVAIKRDKFDDAELQEFINHDVRLLLARKQIAPLAEAYTEASAKGKDFLLRTIRDIDPSVVDAILSGAKRPAAPVAD